MVHHIELTTDSIRVYCDTKEELKEAREILEYYDIVCVEYGKHFTVYGVKQGFNALFRLSVEYDLKIF